MKNEKNNVTTNTTLADSLIYNNRFASVRLNADQLGAKSFDQWRILTDNLHRSAYKVYAQCESSGMKVADSTVDKSEVYDAIRAILTGIGEINGHKLYANEESAIAIIGYAGKRGNVDSPELQYCDSRIRGLRNEIKAYEALNVNDKDYKAKKLAEMNASLEELKAEKDTLLATVDMRYKQPTKTTSNAFRLDVEHFFARTIVGQMAKTLEELDAEKAKRKEERKARAKARKAKKANEDKKANA